MKSNVAYIYLSQCYILILRTKLQTVPVRDDCALQWLAWSDQLQPISEMPCAGQNKIKDSPDDFRLLWPVAVNSLGTVTIPVCTPHAECDRVRSPWLGKFQTTLSTAALPYFKHLCRKMSERSSLSFLFVKKIDVYHNMLFS